MQPNSVIHPFKLLNREKNGGHLHFSAIDKLK